MLRMSLESSLPATSSVTIPRAEIPSTRYGVHLTAQPGLLAWLGLLLQGCLIRYGSQGGVQDLCSQPLSTFQQVELPAAGLCLAQS